MRLDKYMKVTRLIKRREIAKQMIDSGYVSINDKIAKPSSEIKVADYIKIKNPNGKEILVKVLIVSEISTIKTASSMYEIIESK